MTRSRSGFGVPWLAVVVVSACGGGAPQGPSGAAGSSGAAGTTGGAGSSASGADGGADAPVGTPDHSVVVWPSFPPGMCAPQKPAALEGPGVVDQEDLCTRSGGDVDTQVMAMGEWGYGSIGIINDSSADAAYPDGDQFFVRPPPAEGEVVRITVETLSGDLQPQVVYSFNGGVGIGVVGPQAGDPSKGHREVMALTSSIEMRLGVQDFRARNKGDKQGAGAVYRVRVDRVTKTAVALGKLPALVTGDFTKDGIVGAYSFTVPPQKGQLLATVATMMRLTAGPSGSLPVFVLIYDPAKKKVVQYDQHDMPPDRMVSYGVDPMFPTLGVGPGDYWLMVDTPAVAATAASTGYDVSVDFKGPPANDKCTAALDATPPGTAARMLTGDTTFAADDTRLSSAFSSAACQQATFNFLELRGHDLAYKVDVPGRKRLSAIVNPTGMWHPALWVSTDCAGGELSCLDAKAATGAIAPQTVGWTNIATTTRTVFLTVDSEQDSGEFTLATSFTDAPAAPANDTCAGAVAIDLSAGSALINGTTDNAFDDEHPAPATVPAACKDTSANYNGPDVVYSAVVPTGKRLAVEVSPSGSLNPAVWISEACPNAAASCLAARDGDGKSEYVVWTNNGAADKPVVIHVDSQDPVGGAFVLLAGLSTPAKCPGTPRSATAAYVGSTVKAGNDYMFSPANVSATCGGAGGVAAPLIGDEIVSSFVVPAGKTLSLTIKSTVTLNGMGDKYVALLTTACGTVQESGAACVAAGTTALSWKNADAADRTVYLFLDSPSATPPESDYNVIATLK